MLKPTHKFDDMEAVRGLAALGVVIFHYLNGFMPPPQAPTIVNNVGLVVERPFLLALINGPFMVSIFFVLSSFVLTNKLVRETDFASAAVAIAKRFPRLFPLTFVGTVTAAILFALGWMKNDELAEVINSPWLRLSGGVKVTDSWPDPSLLGGVLDSLLLFWRGISQYNSSLWTMKYELVGSLAALATACALGSRHRPQVDALLVVLIALAVIKVHALVSICVVTVYLTKYVCRPTFSLARRWSLAFILVGLVLGSTFRSLPEELLLDELSRTQVLRADWIIHGAGALLILVGVRGWTNSPLEGRWLLRQLGRLSFPMYIIHLPIFASLASAMILALGYSFLSVSLAFVVSMSAVVAASIPLALLDEWWVRTLNAKMRRATNRKVPYSAPGLDPAP